jgi:hypothetical protein
MAVVVRASAREAATAMVMSAARARAKEAETAEA